MINIIPAIDIIEGKCVRLTQGEYSQKKIYSENPLEIAKQFQDYGIKKLHLVDLDGAKSNRIVNYKILKEIAINTHLEIDFGGGIKSIEDVKIAFDNGANQITVGSIALSGKETVVQWINIFGVEKIILGADVKNNKIATNGWTKTSKINISDFIAEYHALGIQYVISTDIAKDGLLQGSSLDLYKELKADFKDLKIIASGGITDISEIHALNRLGIYGAIIGKAIYEGLIKLKDLKQFL